MTAERHDLPILKQIREKLWSGHASVMVGSGFSLNADRASNLVPLPPSWSGLAARFAKKLYPESTESDIEKITGRKHALQLAQEFETLFQRTALNDFIKNAISDNNLIPTSLFTQLLELPWNDVFTTNYDTLLERAAKGVLGRKYDVVCSCQDLALSENPRIVKLHGSLQTMATPLIVTEEDYRTYPLKFAPFVNTVQQALMENSLCLIGFSGTDPNFLSWLGWVRDNLGEAMPPVYLFCVSPIPNVERDVFRAKNVIPIDLSDLDKRTNEDSGARLRNLFEYLKEGPEKSGEWTVALDSSVSNGHSRSLTVDQIKKMERRRQAYPRWLVMPAKYRDSLCRLDIEWFAIADLEQLPTPWDLKGLYELNWSREKCLLPLLDITVYQTILDRYHLFEPGVELSENSEHGNKELRQMWLDLAFAVYRHHREKGNTDEWAKWDKLIASAVKDDITSLNRLAYERVMMAFVRLELGQVTESMKHWDEIERPPYWSVKHAAILCELGEDTKGVAELENTLNKIRPLIPKGRIKNDYELLSLEGVILCILNMAYWDGQPAKNDTMAIESRKIRQRLRELATFQCSPLEEADRFQILMSAQEIPDFGRCTRRVFDITNVSISVKNGLPKSMKTAYQCARFYEESCLPLYVGMFITSLTDALHGCISRLAPVAPTWAFALFCRLGAKNGVDEELFFSQRHLSMTPLAEIQRTAENAIRQVRHLLEECPDLQFKNGRNYHSTAINVLLEILSRLSFKVSDKTLEEIFDVGVMVLKSMAPGWNNVVINLFDKFFKRLVRSMNGSLLFRKMPDLLYLASPIVAQRYSHFWRNPFEEMEWHGFMASPNNCSPELVTQIDGVIEQVKSEQRQTRSHAFVILDRLHNLGILSERQLCQFGRNILLHMGERGLPDFDRVFPHGYLLYLAPVLERVIIEERVRNEYLKFDFKIHLRTATGWVFSDEHFEDIVHSMLETMSILAPRPERRISLNAIEAKMLFHALEAGINATSKEVQEAPAVSLFPEHDAREVFKKSIGWYDRVLGEVIIPHLADKTLEEAKTWVERMNHQVRFPVSDLALHRKDPEQLARIAQDIVVSMSSENNQEFSLYLQTYVNWCQLATQGVISTPSPEILRGLINVIAMRTGRTFKMACRVLGQIAKDVCFTTVDENILMENLERLLKLTTFEDETSRFPLEERLDFRVTVAKLSGRLYHLYELSGQPIPRPLIKWKEACESTEELLPVRTAWTDEVFSKTC